MIEHRDSLTDAPPVEVARERALPTPAPVFPELFPELLGDAYGDEVTVHAETREEAMAVLAEIFGPDWVGAETWKRMRDELSEEWLLAEPMPEDSPYYAEAVDLGGPHPLHWVRASEDTPGAARYWRWQVDLD